MCFDWKWTKNIPMLVFNQRKSRARSETTRAGAYNRGTFKSSSAMSSASARDLDASSFETIVHIKNSLGVVFSQPHPS